MQQMTSSVDEYRAALVAGIRRAYDCRAAGHAEGVLECMADDVHLWISGSVGGQPLVPALQGKDAVRAYYTGFLMRWDLSGMQIDKTSWMVTRRRWSCRER